VGLVPLTGSRAAWLSGAFRGRVAPQQERWTALLWHRFTTRRTLTAVPADGGAGGHRPSHVPLVVREPETGWFDPQTRATVTVAALLEHDSLDTEVVTRLAEVADDGELLVTFGSGSRSLQLRLVAELRLRLPRRIVLPMRVRHRHDDVLPAAATVEELLDAGRLPVVVTPPAAVHDVTAEIASYLRADRVLRVLGTATGADLYPVWRRREPKMALTR
jgi:hypothetical protein